jgi:hypothetical protein
VVRKARQDQLDRKGRKANKDRLDLKAQKDRKDHRDLLLNRGHTMGALISLLIYLVIVGLVLSG